MPFGNTNFKIKKGTPLVGGLKPDKVKQDKKADKTIGHELAGKNDKFGNNGTC